MNNLEYFNGGVSDKTKLVSAYLRFAELKHLDIDERILGKRTCLASFAVFADAKASVALDIPIGAILEPRPGMYATVKEIGSDRFGVYNQVKLTLADGSEKWMCLTPEGRKAVDPKIPKGLVELVRNQLQANCPLKEAKCHD